MQVLVFVTISKVSRLLLHWKHLLSIYSHNTLDVCNFIAMCSTLTLYWCKFWSDNHCTGNIHYRLMQVWVFVTTSKVSRLSLHWKYFLSLQSYNTLDVCNFIVMCSILTLYWCKFWSDIHCTANIHSRLMQVFVFVTTKKVCISSLQWQNLLSI